MSAADMWLAESEAAAEIVGTQERLGRVWNPHVEAVVAEVAPLFGVTPGDVLSECRSRTVAKARAESMRRARERWGYSTTELGRFFGRDASSVSVALRKTKGAEAR